MANKAKEKEYDPVELSGSLVYLKVEADKASSENRVASATMIREVISAASRKIREHPGVSSEDGYNIVLAELQNRQEEEEGTEEAELLSSVINYLEKASYTL